MSTVFEYIDEDIYFHHSLDRSPKPDNFPMHAHDKYEIYYFISGDAQFLVEGSEYQLEPGSIMLMRPAETHKLQLFSNLPYERYAVHFSPGILAKIDPEKKLLEAFNCRAIGQQNIYTVSDYRSKFVHDCFYNMQGLLNNDYDRKLAIVSNLYPILYELRFAFLKKRNEDLPDSNTISKELVMYINNHLTSNDLSLSTLSDRFLLSKCQLNRIFKQAIGSTIWDYVLIKRMMLARQMLRAGVTATEVCQACGFNDYSSFYRLYKKHYNVTPQEDSGKVPRSKQKAFVI